MDSRRWTAVAKYRYKNSLVRIYELSPPHVQGLRQPQVPKVAAEMQRANTAEAKLHELASARDATTLAGETDRVFAQSAALCHTRFPLTA